MRNFLLAVAASCTLLATPVTAQNMRVEYSDLNLASKEGRKALDRRIDAAAREYCNYDSATTGSRVKSPEARRCYREAKAEAKKQLAAIIDQKQLGG